ncbi:MAG TPA: hypothetical protein VFS59_00755 [Gemmatimonadaceae bacterium]|nr:hypothetical protein [Gemmatimonadaceae bacterium]
MLACSSPAESGLGPTAAVCEDASLPAGSEQISVNTERRFQVIDGFGTTMRVWDDPHVTETFDSRTGRAAVVVPPAEQAKILAALYTELGLTRVRYNPRDPAPRGVVSGIEPVNDNADPNVTDLTRFDFSWKYNDAHIAFVKAAQPYGLKVWFASPLTLETWMTESNPQEYVEWAMAILRRWREQGVEMPFYSIANEPAAQSSGAMSPQYILATTKLLGAKLKAEGFKTRIVIPDDITPNDAYDRAVVVLADPEARQYVGAIAYHLYSGLAAREKLKALGEQYSIPVWMTEYALATPFEWANIIHDEIADYGASAVDMQWGFFGQWESTNSHLITILNNGAAFLGWRRTKSFFTTGQYSRFVRPGAQRVEVSSVSGVKVTAYKQGDEIVLVAITPPGSTPKNVSFALGGGPCTAQVTMVRTSDTEDWATLPATQVAGRRFQATLTPGSVTTFVVR